MELALPDLASAAIPAHLARQTLLVHAHRRARGVPTISVLTGDGAAAYRGWRDVLKPNSRPLAAWSTESEQPLLESWLTTFVQNCDLPQHAVRYLSHRTNEEESSILLRIQRGTRHSLNVYWENLNLPRSLRWLRPVLEHLQGGNTEAAELHARIAGLLRSTCDPLAQAFSVFADVCGVDELPAIWVTTHTSADRRPNELAGEIVPLVVDIAEAAPWLPVALWVEAGILDEYLRGKPESHAKAILREGITAGADRQPGDPQAAMSEGSAIISDDRPDDGARSWAERFLFAQLQSRAPTAGIFCLNATLDSAFGGRPMEIDLFARDYSIAVELDGYRHFQDSEAYRRDRRKDLEMQKLGIVVLRFLSDDVVSQLEPILATIDETIAFQRSRREQSKALVAGGSSPERRPIL